MIINATQVLLHKRKHQMIINATQVLLHKRKYQMIINATQVLLHKRKHQMIINAMHKYLFIRGSIRLSMQHKEVSNDYQCNTSTSS